MECNVKYHGIPRVVAPKVRSSRDSVRRRRTLEMKRVGMACCQNLGCTTNNHGDEMEMG